MLDDDGRPIRGAGALPYAGGSGGVGDMSNVTFSRNIFEKPPSSQPRGNFLANYDQILEDIKAGKIAEAEIPETPVGASVEVPFVALPGTTDESREIYGGSGESPQQKAERRAATERELKAEQKRKNLAKARAKREANRQARVAELTAHTKMPTLTANPSHSARMKEVWRKRKEKQNGRAVAMQESAVSEQGERPAAEHPEVRGHDQGPGVSPNGVSDLSQPGGNGGPGVSEIRQGEPSPGQSVQPQLDARQVRAAIVIATQPFHINVPMILGMTLEQAEHVLNELRANVAALGEGIQAKRTTELLDDGSKCTWCETPFTNGFFGRHPFEDEPGSGQWRAIYTCRKLDCLGKFNRAVDEIQKRQREARMA